MMDTEGLDREIGRIVLEAVEAKLIGAEEARIVADVLARASSGMADAAESETAFAERLHLQKGVERLGNVASEIAARLGATEA
jgi:hypothetical protein